MARSEFDVLSPAARRVVRYRMAALVFLVALLLFPVYWMVITSLTPSASLLTRDPPLLPDLSTMSFDAYVDVIANKPMLVWLRNSSAITIASAILATFISAFGGYSLSRFRTRGHTAMGASLLFSRMLPGTLIVIPFFVMASSLELTNSWVAVVAVNVGAIIPFSTWMMKSFFDGIPPELEQAARVDGCSYLGAMRRVSLPLAKPGIAACFTYSAVLAWSDFLFARTLITDNALQPVTVGIASFVGEFNIDWSGLMVASMLSSIPLVILFLLLEPFLVEGMSSGSVKG